MHVRRGQQPDDCQQIPAPFARDQRMGRFDKRPPSDVGERGATTRAQEDRLCRANGIAIAVGRRHCLDADRA
jgi:hypothetical protein